MKYDEFKKTILIDLINKQQDLVNNLEKNINAKSSKKTVHEFVIESYRLASFILEQLDATTMTQEPGENNPFIYKIIKKINPNKWIISDGNDKYTIKRGIKGVFKLDKKDIYCYIPGKKD